MAPAAALVGLALSAVGWGISDTAYWQATRSMRLADSGDLAGALERIEAAMRVDPSMRFYATQRAQYLGMMAVQATADVDGALAAASTAVADEDTYALLRANRAMLLAQSGDVEAALEEMKTARRLDPFEPRYPLWIGALADELGSQDAAREAYVEALEEQPQWIGSAYWEVTPLRREARDAFLRQSRLAGQSLEEISSLSPDCWPQIAQSDGSASAAWDAYCNGEIDLMLRDDVPGALAALDEAIEASPAHAASYALRAEAHQRLGNPVAAEKDARTAIFLGDTYGWAILGKIAEEGGDLEQAAGYYRSGLPQLYRFQGWEGVIYGRRGALGFLPQMDAPGPSRRELAPALALADLYERQGRDADAEAVRDLLGWLDPYFEPGLQ